MTGPFPAGAVFRVFIIFCLAFFNPLFGVTQDRSQPPAAQPHSKSSPEARQNLSSADLTPKIAEDYSTPALTTGSALKSIEPLQLAFDDFDPLFTREITRVQWRPADPIDLYVIKPKGRKKPPVILYLYDYPKENEQYHNAAFCRLLTKQGFAAVGFVPALTGERYRDRPMKEWFVSELKESLATSAHDVQMVLNYLATRGDFDMDRVGMFGDGSGATIAILAASVDSRIKTLDVIDPWGNWPDWAAKSTRIPEKERPAYLKPEWLAGVAPLDPVKWLPELKTPKVRVQFVNDYSVTPPEVRKKIEGAVPANAEIVHYDDAAAFGKAVAGGTGFDWVKEHLPVSTTRQYQATQDSQSQMPSPATKDSAR